MMYERYGAEIYSIMDEIHEYLNTLPLYDRAGVMVHVAEQFFDRYKREREWMRRWYNNGEIHVTAELEQLISEFSECSFGSRDLTAEQHVIGLLAIFPPDVAVCIAVDAYEREDAYCDTEPGRWIHPELQ